VQRSALGGVDQALGFLFGVLRGVLLVLIAFVVFDRAVAANTVPMVDNSRTAKVVAQIQERIDAAIPSDAPGWILTRYNDLTKVCAAPAEAAPAQPAPAPAPANP
jgi:membrane protein required for colicin V production